MSQTDSNHFVKIHTDFWSYAECKSHVIDLMFAYILARNQIHFKWWPMVNSIDLVLWLSNTNPSPHPLHQQYVFVIMISVIQCLLSSIQWIMCVCVCDASEFNESNISYTIIICYPSDSPYKCAKYIHKPLETSFCRSSNHMERICLYNIQLTPTAC